MLSVSAAFAQPELPDGYVSIYSINSETERAPITIDGGANAQVLGPANGWGSSTEYDLSNYEKIAVKINYDIADTGKQVAIRFNVNTSVKLHIVTLPAEGTSFVEEIFLSEYADEDGKALMGGMVFYNGATHWSFSYDGTAATQPCTIEYIAVNEKIELPIGYVSFYSIKPESERAPITIEGGKPAQLAGPGDWGNGKDYDLSDYAKLAFKITYDPADAGHQVAIRFNINSSVKLHIVTLPETGTSVVEEIDLTQYANENGEAINGGIFFYNGATHWSFSYDGTAATQACTIDYIALKKKLDIPEGYVSFYTTNVNMDEEEKAPIAIPAGIPVQLAGPANGWGDAKDYDLSDYDTLAFKINYSPEDAGHQVAIRFNINGSVKLNIVTLPEEGTSVFVGFDITQYADENRNAILGGIVFYNGATHWSFSYDGEPATQECVIGYIAVKEKTEINVHEIPEGYVSLYTVIQETELAPLAMAAVESYQLLGNPDNWGSSMDYNLSNYDTLAIQVVFDSIDIGKEVALRFSVDGWTNLYIIPLDTMPDGQTIVREKIYLPEYANFDGEVLMGGIVFYNGATHWSFSYTDPSTRPATIDFVALNPSTITGIRDIVRTKDPNALVNVYTITGVVLRQNVKYSEATVGLKQGLYIVGHEKVFVAGTRY